MSRLIKALSLALAAATLSMVSIVAVSCGGNNTEYRVFNAMSNPNATFNFDVTFNGTLVTPSGGLGFGQVWPSGGYAGASSGNIAIDVYQTDTTTNPFISGSVSLPGSSQSTIVLMGNSTTNYVAKNFTDNNTLPTTGNIEFRVINAATQLTFTQGVDIYIVPTLSCCQSVEATFTQVAYGQTSQTPSVYVTLPAGQYYVFVTEAGSKTPIIIGGYNEGTTGVYTIVLTDTQQGNTWETQQPVILTDAQ